MSTAAWREAHRGGIAAYAASYRATYREEIAVQRAAWYAEHREEKAASSAAHYATHREEITAQKAAHYAEHREEKAAYGAAYRDTHREEIAARKAVYRTAHREEFNAYNAAYAKANPEKISAKSALRRVRIQGNSIGYPLPDRAAILAEHGLICYLCEDEQTPIDLSAKYPARNSLTWEHILAVVQKGAEATENIRPAHARCNGIKHDKILTPELREHIKARKAQLDLRDKILSVS